MKNLAESRSGCTEDWLNEKKTSRNSHQKYHEVEELKRAQELRIDDFSRHELRESHATVQELASQIEELLGKNFKM